MKNPLTIAIFTTGLTGQKAAETFKNLGHTVHIFENNDTDLASITPDYIITCGYPHKITEAMIAQAKLDAFNIHPSLLPKYRSATPDFWVLKNRDEKTGITIHKLTQDWDSGDIVAQLTFPVHKYDTYGTLRLKQCAVIEQAITSMIHQFEEHKFLPKPQEKSDYYPRPTAKDVEIDWTNSAEDIDALVRAGAAFCQAHTVLANNLITILEVDITQLSELKPGEHQLIDGHLHVGTGSTHVILNIVETQFGIFSGHKWSEILQIHA